MHSARNDPGPLFNGYVPRLVACVIEAKFYGHLVGRAPQHDCGRSSGADCLVGLGQSRIVNRVLRRVLGRTEHGAA